MTRPRIIAIPILLVILLALLFVTRSGRDRAESPTGPLPPPTPPSATPAPTGTRPAEPPADTAAPTPVLRPPPGYLALSAPIDTGALPEPAPLRRSAPERQAEELASAVFARDSNSVAALYAAVLASGYAVRKRNGSIVRTVEPGQGIVLEEFEVASMAKLYGLGYGATLKHLGDSFRRAEPWKELQLEAMVQAGLQAAAVSATPEVKFWALFITELGHRAPQPYDLLTEEDPTKARLDAIQLQLLLTRLGADYALLHPPVSSAAPRPRVFLASWTGAQGSAAACSPTTFSDYAAVAATTVFGAVAESMGGTAARYGQAVQRANLMLVVAKFIATYAVLDHDLKIEGGQLVRTKGLEPGEQTAFTDRVNIQDTWAQYVNCARQILNSSGLDMALPDAGPVQNVRVWWDLIRGRETLVFFPNAVTGRAGGGMSYTNSDGVAKAIVSGVEQAQDLSRRRIVRVDKTASVRASAQVKSTKMENAGDALSTAGDYGSLVLAFFTGDPGGAVAGVLTENFYRASWGYSEPFEFTVVDWEPCENVWSGTISYFESFVEVGSGIRPGVNRQTWSETMTYTANTRIWQSRQDGEVSGSSTADASLIKLRFSTGLRGCYYVNTQITNVKGSGAANAYLNVSIRPNGDYRVGYTLPLVEAGGTYTVSSKKQGECNNPFNPEKTDTQDELQRVSPEANLEIKGHVDPNAPDVLIGAASEAREVRDGVRRATVTWMLKRCPGSSRGT